MVNTSDVNKDSGRKAMTQAARPRPRTWRNWPRPRPRTYYKWPRPGTRVTRTRPRQGLEEIGQDQGLVFCPSWEGKGKVDQNENVRLSYVKTEAENEETEEGRFFLPSFLLIQKWGRERRRGKDDQILRRRKKKKTRRWINFYKAMKKRAENREVWR